MTVWGPERVDMLKRLWAEGLSAARIGHELGITRNSAIGKAHRMGLEGRKQAPSLNPIRIRAKRERTMPIKLPARELPQPPVGEGIPFMKANSRTCRSVQGYEIVSSGHTLALFCPNPKNPESSFCAYHQNIYYRKDAR